MDKAHVLSIFIYNTLFYAVCFMKQFLSLEILIMKNAADFKSNK